MSRVVRPGGSVMLVYPAEPVRGLYAVPSAVILHGNPLRARQVHCHRFTPRRMAKLAQVRRAGRGDQRVPSALQPRIRHAAGEIGT